MNSLFFFFALAIFLALLCTKIFRIKAVTRLFSVFCVFYFILVLWLLFLHFVWSWRRSARLIFYSLSKMISFEFGLIYMHVTFNELQSLCWICPFEKKPKTRERKKITQISRTIINRDRAKWTDPGDMLWKSNFRFLYRFFANLSLNSNELQMKSRQKNEKRMEHSPNFDGCQQCLE